MTNDLSYPVLAESTYDAEEKEWTHSCGTILLATAVVHPIHDSPIPLTGSGRTYTEIVPYCPKCQSQPSRQGVPLRQDPNDIEEAAILRRMRDHP
jgi:hypothetical protein